MEKKENIFLSLLKFIFQAIVCFYLIFHILNGKYNLYSLNNSEKLLEDKKNIYNKQLKENQKKINKISGLNKGNLDLDLLEEEVKKKIGTANKNEIVIFRDDSKNM